MNRVWMISGPIIVALGLQAGTMGVAAADNSQGFDALVDLNLGDGEETTLLEMSDSQLGSVIGGEFGFPIHSTGVSSNPSISSQVTQILNQILAGQTMNQSGSTTRESSTTNVQSSGDTTVVVQQTQGGTQSNGPQPVVVARTPLHQSDSPVTSLPQIPNISITAQPDGTTRVVTQNGGRTITIIIPFPVSSHTLLNAIPFQNLVSVSPDVVRAIQELSIPMIGSPPTMLRMH
ncbi:hypothetical protein [Nitrospira sp. Nam80]